MKQTNKRTQKRTVVIAIAGLIAVLLVTGCLLLTAKSRVIGKWVSEPFYLEEYSSDCTQYMQFDENGTFSSLLQSGDGMPRSIDLGTWEMSGLEIRVTMNGEMGKTIYRYHQITNKLTCGLWTYKKAD